MDSDQDSLASPIGEIVKRTFDVVFALLGLILLAPLFAVVAVWIKYDSPGPVFFRGRRAARGGGTFAILKFRTMYERPESYDGPKITAHNDVRITRLGRLLRDTKLNELPQLWNVLKGEMSLVGPRPEDPGIVAGWPVEVRQEILSLRPGVSSPASVLYRNEEELLSQDEVMNTYLESVVPSKLRLDQLYVRYRSLLLDFDVLLWTLLVLIPRLGTLQPPEENIFWGPVSRLTRRYVSWFAIDTLIALVGFAVAGLAWRSAGPLDVGWVNAMLSAFAFSMVFSISGSLLGVNRISWSTATAADVFDLVPAIVIATSATVAASLVAGTAFPFGMILAACGLASCGNIVVRYRIRLLTGLATRLSSRKQRVLAFRERVLIVGGGQAGQFAVWMLSTGIGLQTYHVVGFVDDDLFKRRLRIRGVKVLGGRDDLPALVEQNDVGLIVFAIHNIDSTERHALLKICRGTRAKVAVLPNLLGSLERRNALEWQDRSSLDVDDASQPTPSEPTLPVDLMLTELAQTAQGGDIAAVQDQIESMRAAFNFDTKLDEKQYKSVAK